MNRISLYTVLSILFLLQVFYTSTSIAENDDLPTFTNAQTKTGIPFVGEIGQAATWGDYNVDGWQDLFLSNSDRGRRRNAARQVGEDGKTKTTPKAVQRSFFFLNKEGQFKEISEEVEIPNARYKTATWADYNNDGFPDLLLGTKRAGMPVQLYKNIDGKSFVDISEEAGITKKGSTVVHGIWGDYNNDGNVDFFQAGKGLSYLYKNNGDGSFEEVSESAKINGKLHSNSALWLDINNDRYLDLLLVNKGLNKLYLNNKDGTFQDITERSGLAGEEAWRTSSACTGDYNQDGYFDIYVTNIGTVKRNALYKNNGDGTFTDITEETETGDVGDGRTCAWVDFNADGKVDLFSTNHVYPNKLFLNLGNDSFKDVATEAQIDKPIDVFAATWGDYNRDGFIDAFLNGHIGTGLMKNNGNKNNSITLRLIGNGSSSNSSAIGARVELVAGEDKQYGEVSGGRGCCEQDMLPLYFGLGKNTKTDINVTWPSGEKCSFENVSIEKEREFTIHELKCDIIPSKPVAKK